MSDWSIASSTLKSLTAFINGHQTINLANRTESRVEKKIFARTQCSAIQIEMAIWHRFRSEKTINEECMWNSAQFSIILWIHFRNLQTELFFYASFSFFLSSLQKKIKIYIYITPTTDSLSQLLQLSLSPKWNDAFIIACSVMILKGQVIIIIQWIELNCLSYLRKISVQVFILLFIIIGK